MTATAAAPTPVDLAEPRPRHPVLTVAVVAGVALGVVDLLLQLALPYPWANLANSGAMWALAALGLGAWAGRGHGPLRAALGGGVMLVVAVAAYHLAAALVLGDDVAVLWAPPSLLWMLFGAISGPAFAAAGALTRRGAWWRTVAAAGAGALCFAEYAVLLVRYDAGAGGSGPELVGTAVLTAVVGLIALAVTARSPRLVGRAMLLAVPFTALAYLGFTLAGFTG